MRSHELEAWVLSIVDRVRAGEPVEDARVELKSEWPSDSARAARRLAGHCNASRGEPALWLIGVHETEGVLGAKHHELARWLEQVRQHFESVAPELLLDINVPTDERTAVALLFDTDRAPYVVKNPVYGKTGAGSVEREVPWRDGTAIRSARREDLLRLLSPIQRLPSVEIRAATLEIIDWGDPEPNISLEWELHLELYVEPHSRDRIVIPFHRCHASLAIVEDRTVCELDTISMGAWMRAIDSRNAPESPKDPRLSQTVSASPTEALIDGPGLLLFKATRKTGIMKRDRFLGEGRFSVVLAISAVERPIRLSGLLRCESYSDDDKRTHHVWRLARD